MSLCCYSGELFLRTTYFLVVVDSKIQCFQEQGKQA